MWASVDSVVVAPDLTPGYSKSVCFRAAERGLPAQEEVFEGDG